MNLEKNNINSFRTDKECNFNSSKKNDFNTYFSKRKDKLIL